MGGLTLLLPVATFAKIVLWVGCIVALAVVWLMSSTGPTDSVSTSGTQPTTACATSALPGAM